MDEAGGGYHMGRMGASPGGSPQWAFFLCDDVMLSAACEILSWTASHLGPSLIVALLIAMILLGKD